MARYSSDSDDDRRRKEKRPKTSRKRDRRSRSRSRDRGRRSGSHSRSSRSHRRRSRSVERRSRDSSYDRSRRASRKDRDRRSRSRSSSRSSGEHRREKRDKENAMDKTKERLKEALNAAEGKDDVLLKAKERKKLGKEVIPTADAIADIDSHDFVQQSFLSNTQTKQVPADMDEDVLFGGTRVPSIDTAKSAASYSCVKEGIFAASLFEDENKKMERWVRKLASMRNKIVASKQ